MMAVNGPRAVAAWAFPSSRGTTTYETVLYGDGSTSCSCPGWVFKKSAQDRGCKHTRQVEEFARQRRVRPQLAWEAFGGKTLDAAGQSQARARDDCPHDGALCSVLTRGEACSGPNYCVRHPDCKAAAKTPSAAAKPAAPPPKPALPFSGEDRRKLRLDDD